MVPGADSPWQNTDVTRELPSTLIEQIGHQNGVFTREQALAAGISDSATKFRVRQGTWRRICTGVYSIVPQPLDLDRAAVLWAAVLYSGAQECTLSHETAAELHGLTDGPSETVHVSVPSSRRVVPQAGMRIHRMKRLGRTELPAGELPCTSIENTVLDLTEMTEKLDDAYDWLGRALGRQLATSQTIGSALASRTRIRWRPELLQALGETTGRGLSLLEQTYVRDVEQAHGLPASTRGERRDRVYRDYGVAIHLGEDRWPVAYQNPCAFAGAVALLLRDHGWAGAVHPSSADCPIVATEPVRH